jgi:hypothetical protein
MIWMPAVRYVVLVALVVWLGGIVTALVGEWMRPLSLVAGACGGVILIGLFAMKFVGPPPRAFVPRVALTAVMLLLAAGSTLFRTVAAELTALNLALGLVLLFWYVKES